MLLHRAKGIKRSVDRLGLAWRQESCSLVGQATSQKAPALDVGIGRMESMENLGEVGTSPKACGSEI